MKLNKSRGIGDEILPETLICTDCEKDLVVSIETIVFNLGVPVCYQCWEEYIRDD